MKPRPLLIIIVCIALVLQCGCSGKPGVQASYRDLAYLRLIQTIGLDDDPAGVRITAATGQVQEGTSPVLISRCAGSIPQAMSSVEDYASNGILFYSHCLFVVLGREKAEDGISDILDYMQRNEHMRMDTGLVVMRNASAQEFMTGFDTERDITEAISSMKRDAEDRGSSRIFGFRETALALSERGCALVFMVEMVPADDSVYPETGYSTCRPAGYGVFSDGKLSGYISYGWPSSAVGLLRGWLGTTEFTLPGGIGVQSSGSDAKIKPVWQDGRLKKIKIDASMSLGLTALETPKDPEDDQFYDRIQTMAGEELRSALEEVIALQRSLNADFLDFTTPVRISGGADFDGLPEDWLKTVEIELGVECKIDRSFGSEDNPTV